MLNDRECLLRIGEIMDDGVVQVTLCSALLCYD